MASDPTFVLADVAPVTRRAGDGIVAAYEIGSDPTAVKSDEAMLSVQRYEFFHDGSSTVVLTLSGPSGVDSVGPWRAITDSLDWDITVIVDEGPYR